MRHLFAALDLGKDRLYGHIKPVKRRTQFLEFCRYLRSLYPLAVRIAIVSDNFSPHLTRKKCQSVGTWAAANNVEMAYTPANSSWLNRIEAQFTTLRYFTLDGTDHADHKEQGSMIRRYIIWRNRQANHLPGGEQGTRIGVRDFGATTVADRSACRWWQRQPVLRGRRSPPDVVVATPLPPHTSGTGCGGVSPT